MLMSFVLAVLCVMLSLAVWVAMVEGRYPLPAPRPTRLTATTADGWTVAVWHRPAAQRRFREAVVLCPGLANNASFFDFAPPQSLATYLAERGFDCYAVDLRGAGASGPPHEGPWEVSVDDYVERDVPAILELVQRCSGTTRVLWVGHSLGGLVGLAASGGALRGRLAALVTIGSPVYLGSVRQLRSLLGLAQWLAPWGDFDASLLQYVAPLAGRVALPERTSTNLSNIEASSQRLATANVFARMWRGVLAQLEDWMVHDTFQSADGRTDYRASVATVDAPLLVVGGSVDALAPEAATRAYFELARASSTHPRALALFGRAHGHSAEYGHGDLVLGRRAHLEVYPVIERFLAAAATAVASEVVDAGPASSRAPSR